MKSKHFEDSRTEIFLENEAKVVDIINSTTKNKNIPFILIPHFRFIEQNLLFQDCFHFFDNVRLMTQRMINYIDRV